MSQLFHCSALIIYCNAQMSKSVLQSQYLELGTIKFIGSRHLWCIKDRGVEQFRSIKQKQEKGSSSIELVCFLCVYKASAPEQHYEIKAALGLRQNMRKLLHQTHSTCTQIMDRQLKSYRKCKEAMEEH